MRLSLYVVGPDHELPIARGSAIVGAGEIREGMTMVYFEGNLYGAENLRRFDERVEHAAARLVEKYPTAARMQAETAHLMQVGLYDTDSHSLDVTHPEALEAWAGERVASGPTQWAREDQVQQQLKEHMRRGLPMTSGSFHRSQ